MISNRSAMTAPSVNVRRAEHNPYKSHRNAPSITRFQVRPGIFNTGQYRVQPRIIPPIPRLLPQCERGRTCNELSRKIKIFFRIEVCRKFFNARTTSSARWRHSNINVAHKGLYTKALFTHCLQEPRPIH